jgi:hypothetical protein
MMKMMKDRNVKQVMQRRGWVNKRIKKGEYS